jgi:hypothetical protein
VQYEHSSSDRLPPIKKIKLRIDMQLVPYIKLIFPVYVVLVSPDWGVEQGANNSSQ